LLSATPITADIENVEHSCLVAAYNRALLLFCARQYVSALAQLESAFRYAIPLLNTDAIRKG
jgi:hypothetical protein